MAKFKKTQTGNPDLDRVQQRIQEFAESIPAQSGPVVVSVSSDYRLTGNEDVVHVDAQNGPVRVTLLAPSSANRPVTIKQVNPPTGNSSVNQVTVATADGSKTIAGASSYALDTTGTGSVTITADDRQHWPSTGGSASTAAPPSSSTTTIINQGSNVNGVPPVIVTPPAAGAQQALLQYDGTTLVAPAAVLKFRQSAPTSLVANPTGTTADVIDAPPAGGGGITSQFGPPPIPVSGLTIRFRASDLAGADGSTVSRWCDVSGYNNVAVTQAGAPVLKTGANGINGHSIVRFTHGSALSCYMSLPLNPSAWAGMSVYYVLRTGAIGDTYAGVFGWQTGPSWLNIACGSDASTGQGAGWAGNGGIGFGNVTGYAHSKVFVASYRYDKTLWTIEGVNTSTHADTAWPPSNVTALIGSNTYPGSQSDSDIAEIIVFNRKLTDDEDAQVLAWLNWWYGQGPATGYSLQTGYPETITNIFVHRYVHPAGSDTDTRYDGKTWQTAKRTVLGAYDSAVNETGTLIIHFEDGSYIGGDVQSQGFWINLEATGTAPGWRKYRPFRLIGYGGFPGGQFFLPTQARLYRGQPGDSQTYDRTKPYIWITDVQSGTVFENIQPGNGQDGIRVAVKRTSDGLQLRDGLCSNIFFDNVVACSAPDTNAQFGPAWDCGWVNYCFWNNCGANGSATITTTDPAVLEDDNHAGWLFRPSSDASGNGPPGSMGYIRMTGMTSAAQCGIKLYLGHDSSFALDCDFLITENGPVPPHVVQLTALPGYTPGSAVSPFSWLRVKKVQVADVSVSGTEFVWIDPRVIAVGVYSSQFSVGDIQGGVSGPVTFPNYNDTAVSAQLRTTPAALRQSGFRRDGYIDGRTDAARRVVHGAPPISDANTGPTNLVTHDTTLWTSSDPVNYIISPSQADLHGLNNACQLPAGDPATRFVTITSNRAIYGTPTINVTLATGDIVVAGVWTRSTDGDLTTPSATVSCSTGSWGGVGSAQLDLLTPLWLGNHEDQFSTAVGVYQQPGGSPVSVNLTFIAHPSLTSTIRVAYPFLIVLKVADGWTLERAYEWLRQYAPWNPALAQGSAGTLRGQPFVASGGIGVEPSVIVTPSGSAAQSGNLPIYGADGRTVIAWVPTIGSNKQLSTVGDHKVQTDSGDANPDYLFNKIESTSGTIAITDVSGGGGKLVNLNVLPETTIDYFVSIPSLQAVNTANQQVATSNPTPYSSGVTTNPIEYPCKEFIAQHVYLDLNLIASIGVASSVDVWVTRNGTLIAGTDINFTPGTTGLGTISVGPIATGSASANDKYGLQQVYNGNAVTGPFGAQMAYTATIRLTSY